MSCTLFKLYLEILNGQAVEKTPKWTGVFGISEALNDIQATFEQMEQNAKKLGGEINIPQDPFANQMA